MTYASPEKLGFYKEIGLTGRPTDFELELEHTVVEPELQTTDIEPNRQQKMRFKVKGDPFVHVTSDFLNHRATHVFDVEQISPPPVAGDEKLVLKVHFNSF